MSERGFGHSKPCDPPLPADSMITCVDLKAGPARTSSESCSRARTVNCTASF